jgi:hypothetical protein
VEEQSRSVGISPPIACILLVGITILLALLVYILLTRFMDFSPATPLVASFLQIQAVIHTSESGASNLDSRIVLVHTGKTDLENDHMRAVFLRNNQAVSCNIVTLSGHRFIGTNHYGVQRMEGAGCSGTYWTPREKILIDFSDGTFRPGDLVTAEFYDTVKGTLISRHSYRA